MGAGHAAGGLEEGPLALQRVGRGGEGKGRACNRVTDCGLCGLSCLPGMGLRLSVPNFEGFQNCPLSLIFSVIKEQPKLGI